MSAKAVIYLVAAVLIAVLVVANWGVLSGPVELNFLIARPQAPLALLLLLFGAILLLVAISVQAIREYAWRRERRSLTTALEAARVLAEKEEASRTGALKATVQSELAAIRAQLDRVLALQSTTFERANDTLPSEALEPELIPPREARSRGSH